MLSPVVLHSPYGGSGSACQPAGFATAVPIDLWLELEVATADELCGLVFACPNQEQLGQLCINNSLFLTTMVTKRVQGNAVLVDMPGNWRPWSNWPMRFLAPSTSPPRPECSPYVAANALEMLGAKAVIFGAAWVGQPPPLLQAQARAVRLPICTLWKTDADALRSATPTHVGLRHFRVWSMADEARPTHLAARLLAVPLLANGSDAPLGAL